MLCKVIYCWFQLSLSAGLVRRSQFNTSSSGHNWINYKTYQPQTLSDPLMKSVKCLLCLKFIESWNQQYYTGCMGHMEEQEMEMKWKLEMEIWNRNDNKICTNRECSVSTDSWVVCFVITLVLDNYRMGLYKSCALPLFSYCVCIYSVIMYSLWLTSTHGKWCCNLMWFTCDRVKTSYNLTMRKTYLVLEQGLHSYSLITSPSPTSRLPVLGCVSISVSSSVSSFQFPFPVSVHFHFLLFHMPGCMHAGSPGIVYKRLHQLHQACNSYCYILLLRCIARQPV